MLQERLRAEEQRHRSELESAEASKAQKERLEAELKGAEGSWSLHLNIFNPFFSGNCLMAVVRSINLMAVATC